MAKRANQSRVLIYSHDSFGLGHLRRCRTIAHALAERNADLSALILSGSPIIGSFDFSSRVDFIRIPGVIKRRGGEYVSLNLRIDTEETLALRSSIIEHTAEIFDPDLFIVDKEPLGLRGEGRAALELMRDRGTPTVLGLRDVLDEPALLAPEWERKNAAPALDSLYDHIWVYGLPEIWNPLQGIELPPSVQAKVAYTGYLRRRLPARTPASALPFDGPFILVTPGGGGDGERLIDRVLRAYEADRTLPYPALIVAGPFMPLEWREKFQARAEALSDVALMVFDSQMERLVDRAAGIVAMGGYNTFCEILSFDKPALLAPRTEPRREQFIRASRAAAFGLVALLEDDEGDAHMVAALRRLPDQPRPSEAALPGLLDGLDNVNRMAIQAIAGSGAAPTGVQARSA